MSGPSSPSLCLVAVLMAAAAGHVAAIPSSNNTIPPEETGGFQAGVLYVTPKGRLTMPQGTLLVVTPTLSLPMGRDFPLAYGASATISMPFRITLDDLGLTSVANSWGTLNRVTRQAPTEGNLAGGDRELVYRVAENTIQSAGLDGRACLLRTICEINLEAAPENFGLFGEVLQLLFSPTRSPRHLGEYTEAEVEARTIKDCSRYYERCPYSFFKDQQPATATETVNVQ